MALFAISLRILKSLKFKDFISSVSKTISLTLYLNISQWERCISVMFVVCNTYLLLISHPKVPLDFLGFIKDYVVQSLDFINILGINQTSDPSWKLHLTKTENLGFSSGLDCISPQKDCSNCRKS